MANSRNYSVFFSPCLLLLFLLLNPADSKCHKSFQCGNFALEFPFTRVEDPDCGLIIVDGCDTHHPQILMKFAGWRYNYTILNMTSPNKLRIRYTAQDQLRSNYCVFLGNVSLSKSPSLSFALSGPNLTAFTCYNQSHSEPIEKHLHSYRMEKCNFSSVYYKVPETDLPSANYGSFDTGCSMIQLPVNPNVVDGDLFDLLAPEFTVEWNLTEDCYNCHNRGGQCANGIAYDFKCNEKKGTIVSSENCVFADFIIVPLTFLVCCICIYINILLLLLSTNSNYIIYYIINNYLSERKVTKLKEEVAVIFETRNDAKPILKLAAVVGNLFAK